MRLTSGKRHLIFIACYLLNLFVSAEQFNVILPQEGHAPYSFVKNSPVRGIFLDILDEISIITQDTYIANYYPAARTMMVFGQGEADIEPGVNPNWRQKWHDISLYSVPFGFSTDVVFFRKGETITVDTVDDLTEKHIVTIRGYIYPTYQQAFSDNIIYRYDVNHELQLMKFLLKANRGADAGFINRNILLFYMKEYNMEFDIGNIIDQVPVMFRFHRNKKYALEKFNKALTRLVENGTVAAIFKKYH